MIATGDRFSVPALRLRTDDMSLREPRPEYLRFWSLDASPFVQRDPNRFFSGLAQRNALVLVDQFVSSGDRIAILKGESGNGVTRLLEFLAEHAGIGDCAVEMVLASSPPMAESKVRTIWLVDHSTSLHGRFRSRLPEHVSVIICSDTKSSKALDSMSGGCPWIIELANMSLTDAHDYVTFAIRMAGCQQNMFTESAIRLMHQQARGRIRDFAQLAENALWEAWASHATEIGPRVIHRMLQSDRRIAS